MNRLFATSCAAGMTVITSRRPFGVDQGIYLDLHFVEVVSERLTHTRQADLILNPAGKVVISDPEALYDAQCMEPDSFAVCAGTEIEARGCRCGRAQAVELPDDERVAGFEFLQTVEKSRTLGRGSRQAVSRPAFAFPANADTSPPQNAAPKTQAAPLQNSIDDVVKYCVDVVHRFPADQLEKSFYKKFDAFYNSASGRVVNNAIYSGDAEPLARGGWVA
jgi:hypothetical protein